VPRIQRREKNEEKGDGSWSGERAGTRGLQHVGKGEEVVSNRAEGWILNGIRGKIWARVKQSKTAAHERVGRERKLPGT